MLSRSARFECLAIIQREGSDTALYVALADELGPIRVASLFCGYSSGGTKKSDKFFGLVQV